MSESEFEPTSTGRRGIVAPLLTEARCLLPSARPGALHHSGNCLVVVSGMGPARAATAAEALADEGCTLLVSFGTAGALDASLASGDLLLTTRYSGATARNIGDARQAADAAWSGSAATATLIEALAASAQAALPEVRILKQAELLTLSEVVEDETTRRSLARQSGAVAVDMESAAIAAVARRRGIGFLAVRTIVDTVAAPLPPGLLHHVDPWGRPRATLALALLCQPTRLLALLDLARRMATARRSLVACAKNLLTTDIRTATTA